LPLQGIQFALGYAGQPGKVSNAPALENRLAGKSMEIGGRLVYVQEMH